LGVDNRPEPHFYLARSANLPEGLYIFSLFFFNGRLSSHRSSDTNGAIFTKISGLLNWCKGLLTSFAFLIFQGTLPWQPVKVEKSAFLPDQSTLSLCHSETEWDNAVYMHA